MSDLIRLLDNPQAITIELTGSLDESLSSQLESVLAEQDVSSDQRILIDLGKVPEVTPDGVRVLLNIFIKQGDEGLFLKKPNDDVKQLLTTVGLESAIKY